MRLNGFVDGIELAIARRAHDGRDFFIGQDVPVTHAFDGLVARDSVFNESKTIVCRLSLFSPASIAVRGRDRS
jgi:hypothetical protein